MQQPLPSPKIQWASETIYYSRTGHEIVGEFEAGGRISSKGERGLTLPRRAGSFEQVGVAATADIHIGASLHELERLFEIFKETGVDEGCVSDANIIIPMQGSIDSMNVSTAAAVVIFEAKRQRNFS